MKVQVLQCAGSAILVLAPTTSLLWAQTPNPGYQTRRSQCRHEAAPGTPLATRRTDSGITTRGFSAFMSIPERAVPEESLGQYQARASTLEP